MSFPVLTRQTSIYDRLHVVQNMLKHRAPLHTLYKMHDFSDDFVLPLSLYCFISVAERGLFLDIG